MGAEDEEPKNDPKPGEGEGNGASQTDPKPGNDPKPGDDPKPGEGEGPDDDDLKDSHGQQGINKERHDKEVAELQAEIERLKAEAADAAENKSKREEFEKRATELEAKLADERVTSKLELAGCRNVKAAKALLDDYDGDVAKLKSECPYLFEEDKRKQSGSTGGKPGGAASEKVDDLLDKSMKIKKE